MARFNVDIPDELMIELRHMAVDSKSSLRTLVIQGVQMVLGKKPTIGKDVFSDTSYDYNDSQER